VHWTFSALKNLFEQITRTNRLLGEVFKVYLKLITDCLSTNLVSDDTFLQTVALVNRGCGGTCVSNIQNKSGASTTGEGRKYGIFAKENCGNLVLFKKEFSEFDSEFTLVN
jgi:hypothetical protein